MKEAADAKEAAKKAKEQERQVHGPSFYNRKCVVIEQGVQERLAQIEEAKEKEMTRARKCCPNTTLYNRFSYLKKM
jgi:hypothetical protein